jgi:hypothetical protein
LPSAKIIKVKRFLLPILLSIFFLILVPSSANADFCMNVATNIACTDDLSFTCKPGVCCDNAAACNQYLALTGESSENTPLCGLLGVNTALGCLIAGDPKTFVGQILGWGVVVGGGISFLMLVFAGLQIVTSAGDPKRVKAAQELITSALSGLILIVISVILLNFIGVSVLNLQNLGFNL